jgi:hypothetical protein
MVIILTFRAREGRGGEGKTYWKHKPN